MSLALSKTLPAPAPVLKREVTLLDLPHDVLIHVMRHVLRPSDSILDEETLSGVEVEALRSALPAAQTCRALNAALHVALDNVCLYSDSLDDSAISAFARRGGTNLKHIVLRSCAHLTDTGILGIAAHATRLRTIDLSFLPHITDTSVTVLCQALRTTLRKVLLRKCIQLTDRAVEAVGLCSGIETLDISYVPNVTDLAVTRATRGCGGSLRLLSISHCKLLTDDAFASIGRHCKGLQQLCARNLPLVSDNGFDKLCRGIGRTIAGIDVLDCVSLNRDPVLRAIRRFCPKVGANMLCDVEGKTLRQIIISTLRGNIFIVHGCDPKSERSTIHMVLVDNGDILSANILSAGTTDLSLLGVVLCKSYGNSLDEDTKNMLTRNYGILPSMLSE